MKAGLLPFLAFLLAFHFFADSRIIGIDFGSTNMKIALMTAGKPFQIVENIASERKIKTAVIPL